MKNPIDRYDNILRKKERKKERKERKKQTTPPLNIGGEMPLVSPEPVLFLFNALVSSYG